MNLKNSSQETEYRIQNTEENATVLNEFCKVKTLFHL